MNDGDEELERFEALLKRSSLAARGHTPRVQAEAAQRIAHLQERLAHARGDDAVVAATELVACLRRLGYQGRAEEIERGWLSRPAEIAVVPAPRMARHRVRAGQGGCVRLALDVETSALTLSVHGTWNRQLNQVTASAVHQGLNQHPPALILDLTDLADRHAASVPIWLTAAAAGRRMDPSVRVMACVAPDTGLADRLGARKNLQAFSSLAQAYRAATENPPSGDRFQLDLIPDGTAAPFARAMVTEACSSWGMPDLWDRGLLVITELVVNAVVHAGTAIRAVVSCRRAALHISVYDRDPRLPRTGDARTGPRQGLRVVDAAASAWGALPTEDGKVVWAIVR
ncbi:ATP-binding protein [Actinoplanes sp. NPDC024001]|uniref:ATP-binding protein n=1 Tax=Actinoplanes sp. NPDC024001 TaxID=3154598 RepID=UPI0033C84398